MSDVMNCGCPPGLHQAPTGAASEPPELGTEEVAPIDYPETPRAWSVDNQWQLPTVEYRPQPKWWRKPAEIAKYLVPAAAIAVAAAFAVGGHQAQPAAKPAPAPPAAFAAQWMPDHSLDAKYLQAMIDGGWTFQTDSLKQENLKQAYWSCMYLSQGHPVSDVVKHWDELPPYPGETPQQNHDDDVQWVGIIVTNLCPQYR